MNRFLRRIPKLTLPLMAFFFVLPVSHGDELMLTNPAEVDMSAERLDRINDWMERSIADKDFAGGVTLVARGGKVVHLETHGWLHQEANIPMREDAIFRLASMTKPVASIALLMLHEEGHFNLDDPISKWLPAYENVQVTETDGNGNERLVPANSPITVRHIMTHTVAFDNAVSPLPDTVEEQVNIIAARPLDDHPGNAWYYRSATNQVGVLVEKISGMSLDDFLRRRLFEPLGMDDTHFNVPEDKLPRVAAIYEPDANGDYQLLSAPAYYPPRPYYSGSGGLSSTIHDYYRLQQMILNGGELDGKRYLSPTTINLMLSNHIGDSLVTLKGPGYGFGLGYTMVTDVGKSREPNSEGTASWGGAYGTMFFLNPEEDMLSIIMIQLRPYSHLRYREIFGALSMQAITRSWKDRAEYKIRATNF